MPEIDILTWKGNYQPASLRLISLICTKKLVGKEYRDFLAHLWDTSSEVPPITLTLIICEFLEVFSIGLHRIDCEIDFT